MGRMAAADHAGRAGPHDSDEVRCPQRNSQDQGVESGSGPFEAWLDLRTVSPVDMRQAQLRLSPSGKEIYDQIAPLALEYFERLQEGLDPQDRAALERGIKRIAERTRLPASRSRIAGGVSASSPR